MNPDCNPHYLDFESMIKRVEKIFQKLSDNFSFEEGFFYVCEIEKQSDGVKNIGLSESYIETGEIMNERIWPELSYCPVILTSATLSVKNKFDYFANELGIKKYVSGIFESPFNYKEQCVVFCPQNTFSKSHEDMEKYVETNIEALKGVLDINPGNTLCLFTAFDKLKEIYKNLQFFLFGKYVIYSQSECSKNYILDEVQKWKDGDDNFMIFATASFFEGVDIDTLNNVIIMNIPFPFQKDPYYEAKEEVILKNGGNPFMDFSLPLAITTIKQKAGRLIRNEQSKGVLSLLDSRITKARYGPIILDSLPHVDENICYNITGLRNAKNSKII